MNRLALNTSTGQPVGINPLSYGNMGGVSKLMNIFNINGIASGPPTLEECRAIALATIFGTNIDVIPSSNVYGSGATVLGSVYPALTFQLPFGLSNVISLTVRITQLLYNSHFQGVNEYSDKPYPTRGLLAVLSIPDTDDAPASDLDSFIRIPWADVNMTTGATTATGKYFIGIVNSTQTEFYTPMSSVTVKCFYEIPRGRTQQVNSWFAVNNAGGTTNPTLPPVIVGNQSTWERGR